MNNANAVRKIRSLRKEAYSLKNRLSSGNRDLTNFCWLAAVFQVRILSLKLFYRVHFLSAKYMMKETE